MFMPEMFIDPIPAPSRRSVPFCERQATQAPTRKERVYKPKKGLSRFSTASMSSIASSSVSFGSSSCSAVDCADVVVRVEDAANGHAKQQHSKPTASPFAAPCVQACTNHQQEEQSSCRQRTSRSKKTKTKLKAVAMFFAKGLSWSAHARPALPVPIYPGVPPVVL